MSRGNRVTEYADGRTEVVAETEPIVFAVMGRDTLEEALVLGDEVRIGQTVLDPDECLVEGIPAEAVGGARNACPSLHDADPV
jgi:hypothetical protein